MVKVEVILDENRLTWPETQALQLEAQQPGSQSKNLLKAVAGAAMIERGEGLVSRVEHLSVTDDDQVKDLVLDCPIPAGMMSNEQGDDCDGCARQDPLRADLCRHVWPHHWKGTLLQIGVDVARPGEDRTVFQRGTDDETD